MIIGSWPVSQDDLCGVPFQGMEGEALDLLLGDVGWAREELFLDNVVACWPPKDDGKYLSTGKADAESIRMCRTRIMRTIYDVDPLIIVVLGIDAVQGLFGQKIRLGNARSTQEFLSVPGQLKFVKYPMFTTYHPADILKQGVDPRPTTPYETAKRDFAFINRHVAMLRELYRQ